LAGVAGRTVASGEIVGMDDDPPAVADIDRIDPHRASVVVESSDLPAGEDTDTGMVVEAAAHHRLEHHAWTPDAGLGCQLAQLALEGAVRRALEAEDLVAEDPRHEPDAARQV